MREGETSIYNDKLLDKKWKEEIELAKKKKRRPSIRRALIRVYGIRFALIGIWKIAWIASLLFGAYWLLKQTMNFVRVKSNDRTTGHLLSIGYLLSSIIVCVAIHQLIYQGARLGLQVKSALMVQIFKKSLVLARIKGGAGDVVNLVTNDCQKIADACTNLQYLWSAGLEIIAILIISIIELTYSAAPAVGIMIILIPVQIYLGVLKSRTGFKNTMSTSKRVHIMSEILTSIKLIKFYAWEKPFFDRITEIRKLGKANNKLKT